MDTETPPFGGMCRTNYSYPKGRVGHQRKQQMFELFDSVEDGKVPLFDILDRLDSQIIEGIHLRETQNQFRGQFHCKSFYCILWLPLCCRANEDTTQPCKETLQTEESVTHASKSFMIHLLPTRNVESNHVRSVLELHCEPWAEKQSFGSEWGGVWVRFWLQGQVFS